MKLISLNTWGGQAGKDALFDFVQCHADVDIFCLQEVWNGAEHMLGVVAGGKPLQGVPTLFSDISALLPEHVALFQPLIRDDYGMALFVRQELPIIREEEVFVYRERGYVSDIDQGDHARSLHCVTLETERGLRTVMNFHGLWTGKGKEDTHDRLLQSAHILDYVKTLAHPFVLCGDYNLSPDTESLLHLERAGLRNLLRESGLAPTRSELYKGPNKYADYILVSEGVEVRDFKVLDEPVSDHLPLYLEWV